MEQFLELVPAASGGLTGGRLKLDLELCADGSGRNPQLQMAHLREPAERKLVDIVVKLPGAFGGSRTISFSPADNPDSLLIQGGKNKKDEQQIPFHSIRNVSSTAKSELLIHCEPEYEVQPLVFVSKVADGIASELRALLHSHIVDVDIP